MYVFTQFISLQQQSVAKKKDLQIFINLFSTIKLCDQWPLIVTGHSIKNTKEFRRPKNIFPKLSQWIVWWSQIFFISNYNTEFTPKLCSSVNMPFYSFFLLFISFFFFIFVPLVGNILLWININPYKYFESTNFASTTQHVWRNWSSCNFHKRYKKVFWKDYSATYRSGTGGHLPASAGLLIKHK